MRILHTADWHIGKTLARQSRLDETRAALDQVVGIAVQEKVDAVLVCGDIFEHQAPSAEAESLAYETLLRLAEHDITTVLIPGNHDHAERWGALTPILDRCSVRVVPEVLRPSEGGIVSVPSRDGESTLQVAALPWVGERRVTGAEQLLGLEEAPMQHYAARLAQIITALCQPLDPETCTVFAGHLMLQGAELGGGERALTLGEGYMITAQALPMVQYAALGHIHKPQAVKNARVPAYYCGSLIQLDFGEQAQDKFVQVVDLEPGLPAKPRAVPITAGRRLRDVTGTLEELRARGPAAEPEWLRVILKCGGPTPGLAESVREVLPDALEVRLEYPKDDARVGREVRGLSPREQFSEYHQQVLGAAAEPETLDLFEAVLLEVG
jgi:exonuclease SbcD